ncbi:MAG: efflux RND transporter periplasmic adaptor subunit [Simkaniaceae bacterium]|nr:efflux RND transporter periplasmic adaptor subunit [Simkaniaceae bacterium]
MKRVVKHPIIILWLGIFSFGFLGLGLWEIYSHFYAYTDDAYVEGNKIYIMPLHDGFITDIYTDDTFFVKKGDVIIQLDETDARLTYENEKALLEKVVREVCQTFHRAFAYESDIEVRKAELIKAEQDWQHRIAVIKQGGVSLENLEHAVAALRANYYSMKEVESLYYKEAALIQGRSITDNPFVKSQMEKLKIAWVNLYRCKIYAPVDGLIAQRTAQVGMWFKAGDPLLSLIPLDQIWVNANFKETQMKRMRLGQVVKITSDLYGRSVVYEGKIVGLPGGAGNAFSLLPPQNLSGNWIKIVQRLPVRVALNTEALKKYPLRLGLTMKATAKLSGSHGGLVPTNSNGSPHYTTEIFRKEEIGVDEVIAAILDANIDSSLQPFRESPFETKKMTMVDEKSD